MQYVVGHLHGIISLEISITNVLGFYLQGGSRVYLATASNWKDPATYNQHLDRGELFPDLGTAGTEDP
tara:strand:+ start:431 stop:634 length:204 start_codon:yes stop_codon:yes gene_type:complete